MKYFIQINPQAKHGFELVKVANDGQETIVALDKKTADDYLYLPQDVVDATNRRLIGINGIKKANVERYELTTKEYREPRVLGPRPANGEPRKKLDEYMTEEEKATIADILAKAKARRDEATKKEPMTELEKAQRAYERALAKLNNLKGAQA